MYDARYDEEQIHSKQFDFVAYIKGYLSENAMLLDLGCGTCRKTEKIARIVKTVWGTDRNDLMLTKASENLIQKQITNVLLVKTDNHNTPFLSNSFDICTASLTHWSTTEVFRVLKPGGLFLIETLCPEDKLEIKQSFPEDHIGKRGYLSNQSSQERIRYLLTELSVFFEILNQKTMVSQTTLPLDDLITLLELTPTIRGFDKNKDYEFLRPLVNNNTVTFTEKRLYIVAKKITS